LGISTHILDTVRGRPAAGIPVTLEERRGDAWAPIGSAESDADGRVRALVPAGREITPGTHRLRFDLYEYTLQQDRPSFFPSVEIVFRVEDPAEHYHVPLLLSAFGYTTYRGS
jgi:5-hydroxyisourate hydrolase